MPHADLEFLRGLDEQDLCELVLVPLLARMNYRDVRYAHGTLEHGKDIVFTAEEPLAGRRTYCATVKKTKLSGSVSSSRSIREVFFQIKQALSSPFIDPFDGHEITIHGVYVITPDEISQLTIASIKDELATSENRVNFIDGARVLQLIDDYYPTLIRSLPDPRTRYLETIAQRFLESQALGGFGQDQSLALPDVYTGGLLSETSIEEARFISFARPTASPSGDHIFTVHRKAPYACILADVGAGKTTLLQTFIASFTDAEGSASATKGNIPIFVPLSRLNPDHCRTTSALVSEIGHCLSSEGLLVEPLTSAESGNCVICLDGFDELSATHDRVAAAIRGLPSLFPAGVIVTSRPSRIPDLGADFRYFRLNPFGDDDIKLFLRRWFPGDEAAANAIFSRIKSNEELERFCRTPLMLTLYSILGHRSDVTVLPTKKTDLYFRIVAMLLGDWDRRRRVKNYFRPEIKEEVLQRLAQEAHLAGGRYFPDERVVKIAREVLQASRNRLSEQLLRDELLYRSSLLRKGRDGKYEFVHLSFQEFFVARQSMRMSKLNEVEDVLFDPWWRNVLIFFFGLRNTLDGVSLTKSKRTPGRGLRLMEYLNETEYTSDKSRRVVFGILANDLLFSAVTESDLEMCARLGDDVVRVLRPLVEREDFHGVVGNYARVLVHINSEEAQSALFSMRADLQRLNVLELGLVLQKADSFAESPRGRELALRLLRLIESRVQQPSAIDPNMIEQLQKVLRAASNALDAIDLKDRERKAKELLVGIQGALIQRIRR